MLDLVPTFFDFFLVILKSWREISGDRVALFLLTSTPMKLIFHLLVKLEVVSPNSRYREF